MLKKKEKIYITGINSYDKLDGFFWYKLVPQEVLPMYKKNKITTQVALSKATCEWKEKTNIKIIFFKLLDFNAYALNPLSNLMFCFNTIYLWIYNKQKISSLESKCNICTYIFSLWTATKLNWMTEDRRSY